MPTVLITGGTGYIGSAITKILVEKNYSVIILTRYPEKKIPLSPNISYARWDIAWGSIDKDALASADHIIHLAGAGVADKRWTKKRKQEIVNSRVNSSQLLVESLKTIPNKVKTVVCASGIGWYGPDPLVPNPKPFEEDAPAHNDFLGNTCRLWEQSIVPVTQSGARLVKLRTGIVLSNEGGALPQFKKSLRFGIAAILGYGKQMMSWIQMDDLVNMFITAIENEKLNGVYNAVSPKPVSNKEFTILLARSMKKYFIPIRVPSFVLRLLLGEMSIEVLKSATVSAEKIKEAGFIFKYPEIKAVFEKVRR